MGCDVLSLKSVRNTATANKQVIAYEILSPDAPGSKKVSIFIHDMNTVGIKMLITRNLSTKSKFMTLFLAFADVLTRVPFSVFL